ncbi:MAG TPA: MFS transporter [Chloroflexota bacterium]|nr:MFS transporter [Chloroflexota bacterium]
MRPGRPSARTRTLGALGLVFGVIALDVVMVGGAGPRIAADLRGVDLLGWLFTAYLLAWTVTGPIFGKLADVHGRRPVLLAGLGFGVGGALLASQAATMEQVIACRFVQGVAAGAIMPVAYTAGGDLYPPAERAKGQALFAFVYFVASAVAPPLTGFLVGTLSWRAIFVVDAVLGVLAAAALWGLMAERVERRPHRLDVLGAVLLMVGVGALLLALAFGSRGVGWTAPPQLVLYAVGAAGTAGFFWWEARVAEPLVPLRLFRHRVVLGACLVTLLMGSCLWSISAFVPLLVQGVQRGSAFQGTLISLPVNGFWFVSSALAVPLLWRWGYRQTSVVGMAGLAVGFAVLAQAGGEDNLAYGLVLVGVGVAGLGLGFVNSAVTVAVQNAVPWAERATATSTLQVFRQFGPSVAIAALQTLLNAQFAARAAAQGIAVETLGRAAGAQANALLAPDLQASLSPAALDGLRLALTVALHQTFWLVAAIAVVGCLAVRLLPSGHPAEHVFHEEPVSPPGKGDRGMTSEVAASASHTS